MHILLAVYYYDSFLAGISLTRRLAVPRRMHLPCDTQFVVLSSPVHSKSLFARPLSNLFHLAFFQQNVGRLSLRSTSRWPSPCISRGLCLRTRWPFIFISTCFTLSAIRCPPWLNYHRTILLSESGLLSLRYEMPPKFTTTGISQDHHFLWLHSLPHRVIRVDGLRNWVPDLIWVEQARIEYFM